jgi:hypothetical protein
MLYQEKSGNPGENGRWDENGAAELVFSLDFTMDILDFYGVHLLPNLSEMQSAKDEEKTACLCCVTS